MIDEVQRAPQLLLAIKKSVDEDRRPGRFLLTGSANLMALPTVADSLAGRTETLSLLPLSQSEIESHSANWIDNAFAGRILKVDLPVEAEPEICVARGRAPFFDLWAIASKSERTEAQMRELASEHLPG